MKPIDVRSDSFSKYNEKSNEKDPRFKVANHVRISKYINLFATGYAPNWSEEDFVISEIKNSVPWTYVINNLNGEKVTQKKGNKLYVQWKGYDNSFNSWIDKKA